MRRLGDDPNAPDYPGRALAPAGVNLAQPTAWDWLQYRDNPTTLPNWVLLGIGVGFVLLLVRRR